MVQSTGVSHETKSGKSTHSDGIVGCNVATRKQIDESGDYQSNANDDGGGEGSISQVDRDRLASLSLAGKWITLTKEAIRIKGVNATPENVIRLVEPFIPWHIAKRIGMSKDHLTAKRTCVRNAIQRLLKQGVASEVNGALTVKPPRTTLFGELRRLLSQNGKITDDDVDRLVSRGAKLSTLKVYLARLKV